MELTEEQIQQNITEIPKIIGLLKSWPMLIDDFFSLSVDHQEILQPLLNDADQISNWLTMPLVQLVHATFNIIQPTKLQEDLSHSTNHAKTLNKSAQSYIEMSDAAYSEDTRINELNTAEKGNFLNLYSIFILNMYSAAKFSKTLNTLIEEARTSTNSLIKAVSIHPAVLTIPHIEKRVHLALMTKEKELFNKLGNKIKAHKPPPRELNKTELRKIIIAMLEEFQIFQKATREEIFNQLGDLRYELYGDEDPFSVFSKDITRHYRITQSRT